MSADKPRIPSVSANRISMTHIHWYLRYERAVGNVGVDEQILAFVCCCKCNFFWEETDDVLQQTYLVNQPIVVPSYTSKIKKIILSVSNNISNSFILLLT